MPAGTRVDDCYRKLRAQGHSEASAARICQASTGQALATGKPPKQQKLTADELEMLGKMQVADLPESAARRRKANSYSQDVNAGRVPRNNPPKGGNR